MHISILEHSKSHIMSLVITHGYLLTGTGSNLYVNNLVRELAKVGKEVNLLCQDFDPMAIDFVNEYYEFNTENTQYILKGEKASDFPGKVRVFKPNLNGFLPVYVYDHYEGYTVKEFPDCSDEEVASYVTQNKNALELVVKDFGVEVVNTNHLVMFPHIATLVKESTGVKHLITVHGSALNFTVKKDKRFEEFAKSSLIKADEIIVDSLHADDELKEFLDEVNLSELKQKVEIIPAGVDVTSFSLPTAQPEEMIQEFQDKIALKVSTSSGRTTAQTEGILRQLGSVEEVIASVNALRESYDYRNVDQDVVAKVETLKDGSHRIMFVGKYLWTKGLHLIIFGIPKVLQQFPKAKFVFVGFGPYREPCEVIINALASNKLDELDEVLNAQNPLFKGEEGNVKLLQEILVQEKQALSQIISNLSFDIRDNIVFTGIAEHKELVKLLPAMDALIAPSVFPEAFGMVAIEAMACGVYPVLTYQSAFKEISDEVIEAVQDYPFKINKVFLDENASDNIANNLIEYFTYKASLSTDDFKSLQTILRDVVMQNYSWEGIAQKYLKAYGI